MSEARSVLREQHDRVEAALDGDRSDLFDAFKVLGQMRTQVLYREVRETLDDGAERADASQRSQDELSKHIQAAIDGDDDAIATMREVHAAQREADDEALDGLEAAGADLEALGEQMGVYAG